jgi:hypothetical protein
MAINFAFSKHISAWIAFHTSPIDQHKAIATMRLSSFLSVEWDTECAEGRPACAPSGCWRLSVAHAHTLALFESSGEASERENPLSPRQCHERSTPRTKSWHSRPGSHAGAGGAPSGVRATPKVAHRGFHGGGGEMRSRFSVPKWNYSTPNWIIRERRQERMK